MLGLSATLTKAVFVYFHVRHLRSLYHYLSENKCFVWSETLHNGEKLRCHACDILACESRAVFCWGRIRKYKINPRCIHQTCSKSSSSRLFFQVCDFSPSSGSLFHHLLKAQLTQRRCSPFLLTSLRNFPLFGTLTFINAPLHATGRLKIFFSLSQEVL